VVNKTVLCWSGGKDSTATGILAKINNIKIDEIVTVMPDPFSDELTFKERFSRFMGLPINVLDSPTFEDYFNRVKTKGKHIGSIYGWPFTVYKTCARIMKWEPMQKHFKGQNVVFFLGIATGENRKILEPNRSLLIEHGLTEQDAFSLCKQHGLLNPLYDRFSRLGCVRCPKQKISALKIIKEIEPKKYKWMLENDDRSPVKFKPNKTFREIDEALRRGER